ncbi:MAG TPA: methylated-DNA--[protein]-cysteine S-methyltransferase [Alphaproteobacteria bacterium]|nr:methylated-DNA--[protein]-cysteine S-methyltransferase [Alphaproteobacteria bacterium]HNS44461.1 methylated-DNA--[protein]-cysteine S-methyltransferase [Alphaproteobacteria bacterium]
MKFDQLGLVFDDELSVRGKNVRVVDSGVPDILEFGTVTTSLGLMTLVWCKSGLCYLGFEAARSLEKAQKFFPSVSFLPNQKMAARYTGEVLNAWRGEGVVDLVACGTVFQKSVWEALLRIPVGHVVSYGSVAEYIGSPKAVRAVGSAVGANPVSLLIPCHRVIQQNGSVCNYGWGDEMKRKILKEEALVNRVSGNPASRKIRRAG